MAPRIAEISVLKNPRQTVGAIELIKEDTTYMYIRGIEPINVNKAPVKNNLYDKFILKCKFM